MPDASKLSFYFDSELRRRQLRRGPLAEYLDGFAAELRRRSYAKNTGRRILSIAGQFSWFAGLADVEVADLDEELVDRFLAGEFVAEGLFQDGPMAMRHLLRYLRKENVIAPSTEHATPHPFAATLEGYEEYMLDVRGLAPSTCRGHLANARTLLAWSLERHDDRPIEQLAGTDVLEYVTDTLAHRHSRSSRSHLCSEIRGFLRHLYASGAIGVDLTRAVPRVATPRLASLPRRLPWNQVRALIDGVDTSDPVGMRDKAILLLLATLGLRSYEVRALELGDVAWRAGELRLPRTKTRRERILPLLHEVGTALVDYVLYGRPPLAVPQVFLRHLAPPGPLTSASSIVWIVRRHLRRAGIEISGGGAHMLRHSLATKMVNEGVPIKSVADVLGHKSIDTTAIYTKVDTTTLAAVALPFPGGVR